MNTGKCPKCESIISTCLVEDVVLSIGEQPRWRAFSYSCPSCRTVLSVQMNPLTLNVDLANSLLKANKSVAEEPKA